MIKAIRNNWFGIFLASIILVALVLVIAVSIAPHNDKKMRGFTPCSYDMAQVISFYSAKKDVFSVFGAVFSGYMCYSKVMYEGGKRWIKGEQKTPWENYIFDVEEDSLEIKPELSEPFSPDLIKANKLNDEDGDIFEFKENDDEKK